MPGTCIITKKKVRTSKAKHRALQVFKNAPPESRLHQRFPLAYNSELRGLSKPSAVYHSIRSRHLDAIGWGNLILAEWLCRFTSERYRSPHAQHHAT
jgi:hypothetical protein